MLVANKLGSLSPVAASAEMLQWATNVSALLQQAAYINGGGVNSPTTGASQVFTGATNVFTGGLGELFILGFGLPSVKINRAAPQGAGGIDSALLVYETVPKSSTAFEWAILSKLDSAADAGENVAIYAQAYKTGQAETWGLTVEAQDFTLGGSSAMVGAEISMSYGGVDTGIGPNSDGVKDILTLVYADVAPNGSNPVGPVISIGDCINCSPAANIARFHALTFLKLYGCYTRAILDMTNVHDTPLAVAMGGGSAMFFSSGTGAGPVQTWYPGVYVPTYAGAIRIQIDGIDRWLPVTSNHP